MDSDEIPELPNTTMEVNTSDVNDHAPVAVPRAAAISAGLESDLNRKAVENSMANGDLQNLDFPRAVSGGSEELQVHVPAPINVGGGSLGGEGEADSDLEEGEGGEGGESDDDDDEVEFDDDDMFFDDFEPNPPVLQRNNSIKEPMGEKEGVERESGEIIYVVDLFLLPGLHVRNRRG